MHEPEGSNRVVEGHACRDVPARARQESIPNLMWLFAVRENDDRGPDQHLRGTFQYLPSFIAVGIARDTDQNDRDIVSFGNLYTLVDRCRREDFETSRPRQALREKVTEKRTLLDNNRDWQLPPYVAAVARLGSTPASVHRSHSAASRRERSREGPARRDPAGSSFYCRLILTARPMRILAQVIDAP